MIDDSISRLSKGTRRALSKIIEGKNSVDARLAHGQTCMHISAREGEAAVIEKLLREFASQAICIEDNDGKVPLHEACIYGNIECVDVLLKLGSAVDPLKRSDWTPLMLACENNFTEICHLLLERGARTDLTNKDGWTPLHLAARSGCPSLCDELYRRYPPAIKMPSTNMRLCLHTAALHGNVEVMRFVLKQSQINVNCPDACGVTPLMDSVKSDCTESIELLLKHGADLSAYDKNGLSALHIACSCNCMNSFEYLLRNGVSLNLRTNCVLENTCMHIAVSCGNVACIHYLLRKGADFESKNNHGVSALDLIGSQKALEALLRSYPNARISMNSVYSLNNFL